MATSLPFDLQTEQDSLTRRQQLMQALLTQAGRAPQSQMVSGHFIAPNPLQYLAQAAGAYLSGKMGDEADDAKRALAGRYNEQLSEGLTKYFKTREGMPAAPMGPPTEEGEMGAPAGGVPGDPRKAAIEALTSGIAPLQQLGQADLAQVGKATMTPKDLLGLPGFDPQSRLAAALGGGLEVLKPDLKEHVIGGKIVAGTPSSGYKPVGDFAEQWTEPYNLPGADGVPDLVRKNLATGKVEKIDNSPRVTVGGPTITMPGQKAGFEEWSKLAAKTVSGLAEQARGSVKLLGTLNQLENLTKNGVFQGPTANAATFISSLGESLGMPVDKNKLANSETFSSTAQEAVQSLISQLGGNRSVTEAEAKQITLMAPALSQTPQGRMQLTAFLRKAAERQIQDAQKAQQEYGRALQAQNPAAFTFGLSAAEIPNTQAFPVTPGAAAPAGAPTVSNWNK